MNITDYVIVLTTLPADNDASHLAQTLVDERLAACVNVHAEMQSIYRWEGDVAQDPERQVVIKTTSDRLARLWDRVRELHPYEVPEFLVLPVSDGSESYLKWLRDSTLLR
ncbi:MAG: divalent-cation tolerance protein CutA [Acidobacteria bacterium]|nr:divalent-cation tolerance protein CutA [Acidobacteriota bacterium]